MKSFIEKINTAFKEFRLYYLFVLLLFSIGIVIGVYTVVYMDETNKKDLVDYFSVYYEGFKTTSPNYFTLLISVIKKNLLLLVPIFLLGFTFWGTPFVLVIDTIKGFILGYTFALILSISIKNSYLLSIVAIIPQNLFYIPCFIIISVMSLEMSAIRFKEKFSKNYCNKDKSAFIINPLIVSIVLLIIGIVVEVYVSPNLLKMVVS